MKCRLRHVVVAIAILIAGPGWATCSLRVMELPVTMVGSRAIATVGINGTDVPLMVDTGAFFSFLTNAAAQQLRLPLSSTPQELIVRGWAGSVDTHLTTVKKLQLLKGEVSNIDFIVGGNDMGAGAMGQIGRNILSSMDTEYDLANGIVRFVLPSGDCLAANMAYWAGSTPVSEIKLVRDDRPLAPFTGMASVNGQQVTALMDTGTPTSMLSLNAARLAKVSVDTKAKPLGRLYGAGHGDRPYWSATIDEIEFGDEELRHSQLMIADLDLSGVDLVLGIDFFLSHRIYVSKNQRRMFFTYNGGKVFALDKVASPLAATAASGSPVEGEPADADAYARRGAASAARGDFVHALADLDRACALESTVASHFTRRGAVHRALRQRALATADFDEAIRLDPSQAEARLQRAVLRADARQRDGALEDLAALDATLAPQAEGRRAMARLYARLGMLDKALPQWNLWIPAHEDEVYLETALNDRCWARAMLAIELDKALADCDKAIDRQPRNADFLASRGWTRLRQGEFKKAIADFGKSLAIQPASAWALYGRGIAQLRLGDTATGQADIAAAKASTPAIESEATRYGIDLAGR